MIWTLFEITINHFESWLLIDFMSDKRHFDNREKLVRWVCMLGTTVLASLNLFCNASLTGFEIFIFPLIYSLYRADTKWYLTIYWILILVVIFGAAIGASTQLYLGICQVNFDQVMTQSWLRIGFVFFANMVLFLVVKAAKHMRSQEYSLPPSTLLAFLLIGTGILAVEELLYYLQTLYPDHTSIYLVGYACVIVCLLLTLSLFRMLSESVLRESEMRTIASIREAELQHQREFTQIYSDFVERQHDFKHQIEILQALVARNSNGDAQQFLSVYKEGLARQRTFVTGSIAVDALLTAKHLTMKTNDIEFEFAPYPLSSLPISEIDFCTVVGNLLDNAIEGIQRIENNTVPRKIRLNFARTHQVFHIVCENPCNAKLLNFRNGRWVSSKQYSAHGGLHGLGIRSIQRIVDVAEGYSQFTVIDGIYRVVLNIPFSNTNE